MKPKIFPHNSLNLAQKIKLFGLNTLAIAATTFLNTKHSNERELTSKEKRMVGQDCWLKISSGD